MPALGCPGPPGCVYWGVLLTGARQLRQDALRWCWKRLSSHGCSLMEPALPRSPVPLGSGAPANAVLRGAWGLRGVGVSWCLLHLPSPPWDQHWCGGKGRKPVSPSRWSREIVQNKAPAYLFFPALSLPGGPQVCFSWQGSANWGEVPAGHLHVPVTLWGLLSPLDHERSEPVAGTPPRWAPPGGDPDAIGAPLQRLFGCLCRAFVPAK